MRTLIYIIIASQAITTVAQADDYDHRAPFNGREFNDPKTHERTYLQEQMELMRLQAEANLPFVIPGVASVPRCHPLKY